MSGLVPKILKWYTSAFFLIWGLGFLVMVKQHDHVGPLILAMFSFGIVYWQFKSRSDLSRQVIIASIMVLLAAAGASYYAYLDTFPFNQGFFAAWAAWTLLLGTPVIGWTYWKYD